MQDTLYQKLLWGRKYGAFQSPIGLAIARAVQSGCEDPVTRKLVESEIGHLKKLQAAGQLPPFAASQLRQGGAFLGNDCHGQPVWVPFRSLAGASLVVGVPGSGKTRMLMALLPQLAAAGVTIWTSESYKTELRRLRHLI